MLSIVELEIEAHLDRRETVQHAPKQKPEMLNGIIFGQHVSERGELTAPR